MYTVITIIIIIIIIIAITRERERERELKLENFISQGCSLERETDGRTDRQRRQTDREIVLT